MIQFPRSLNMNNPQATTVITRRHFFRQGSLALAGAVIVGGALAAGPAAAKVSQKGVAYQPSPKGSARCDKCSLWQSPDACKAVNGPISPAGWCNLYEPKG
jgi:hypothetical protein